jgi:signal transduction histidine kinase
VARGQLGLQVPVRTDDELGDLTQSFNQMSSDLAKAAQLRQQMTADIAHDLRTPLTVILGYAEALNDGKLKGDPEIYQALHQQARHLTRLVEDLRTLSLADAGQLSLRRQAVDPVSLLEHTVLAYAGQAEARGVTLRLENGSDIPAVIVDPDRVVQVIGNLISNALRHTPTGGEIVLSAEGPGSNTATPIVQLRVRDSGPGINPDDLPHIFDRFYRGDKARQADGASGLGLAIARSLVEAHGGRIWAENQPQGFAFVFSLPLTWEGAPPPIVQADNL